MVIQGRNEYFTEAPTTGITIIETGTHQGLRIQENIHAECYLQGEPRFTGMWLPEEENFTNNETDTSTTLAEQTSRVTRLKTAQQIYHGRITLTLGWIHAAA